ncbi:glycerol kinase GlpK [Albidovulum sp.]|uniref:glycerol kinase GlpK n=1 Tax=Albidovulum sp. TaxID=1872424 RepID=UPI002BEFC36A|nr:glycerol kinase GlpK [Defluviimonas sp.]MCO5128390.1 glycerol kinase GlpK [Paracoccaceae bacterium]HPE24660.1 glycerol kinase GlpK [Albidovulum sp.]MCP5356290.1 glycerol kinase GlpK [Paracoccaceae bacterium]MCP5375643.1 glycerol kinase GlpK [Paracoccaceae bacterium]
MTYILAIDQGTTSSRAILFDGALRPVAQAQEEFRQHYPSSGWVEHDPDDLWSSVAATARAAMAKAGVDWQAIAAIGITNQRETTLLWDRATGRPLHNAIVWQDRRTADACAALKEAGHEAMISARTGLLLDPYFSGTKLKWLLDTVPGARARAIRGELAFGTVDSWLIWNLTGGRVHATDATNAARTLLFNIATNAWDADICALLDIPMSLLPEVRDCADDYGVTDPDLFGGEIPILGVAGDQQAATVGQACFAPGMMKSTYGTGCFALLNTGADMVPSKNRLLTTIAYRLNGQTTYALEGSIFIAGAVVQWLRDGLRIIGNAKETQDLAEAADTTQELVLVPAFTGLGAPYWRPDCRGAIYGLSRNSGPAEFARAALESVGYQTRDLLEAMRSDWGAGADGVLRVDGGMTANDWAMQFLSDILGAPVDRPVVTETTALGAAYLAAMQAGVIGGPEEFARSWALDRRFSPQMDAATREARYARWGKAVAATMSL